MAININRYKYLGFSLLCGVLATFWKYRFGVGDQLDHLLFVYKTINPHFLDSDPYVQLAAKFSVRYYFARFIGFLAFFFSIKAIYFGLTLAINSILALYTYLVALRLSKGVQLSGVMAAILVLTLTTINMGDVFTIYATGLSPDKITLVLLIMAFYSALMNKPVRTALLCGVGAIFHILLGAVSGFIILFAWFIAIKGYKNALLWRKVIISGLLLFLFTLPTLIPMVSKMSEQISSNAFVNIYAFFRVPHHLLASYVFSAGIGIRSIAFFVAAAIAGYLLYTKVKNFKAEFIFCLIIAFSILFLCLLGYLFLEVFPMRFAVMLQAFRYFTILKWLSLVLIGAYAGMQLNSKWSIVSGLYIVVSTLSPILLGATMVFELVRSQFTFKVIKKMAKPWLWFVVVVVYLIFKIYSPETMVLLVLLALALALNYASKKIFIPLLSLYLSFVVINITVLPGFVFSKAGLNTWLNQNYRPVFTFGNAKDTVNELCAFVKDSTTNDALFIAPPNLLEIRTIGQRASVVSFQTIPFNDIDMLKWKADIDFCYGLTKQLGFNAEHELIENYRNITDLKLLALKQRYGVSYAVLYNETTTSFTVLYRNAEFKVVGLCN